MVRVGGLHVRDRSECGDGEPDHADDARGQADRRRPKKYKVAGWASVSEEARAAGGEPIWDVMARYLRARKTIPPLALNVPAVEGVTGNPGIA